MTDAFLLLAQWLSPGYPVGAFAYSHGLETPIAAGEVADGQTLGAWIGDLIDHGTGRTDAILLRAAHLPDADLRALDATARAWSGSAERRHETVAQGTAFARTTAAIWGFDLPPLAYPVAVGRAAGLAGVPAETAAALYLQAVAANLVSAAVRRVPLGQTEGQRVLAELSPLCIRVARETEGASPDDMSQSAFAAEIAAMHHETLEPRTFRT